MGGFFILVVVGIILTVAFKSAQAAQAEWTTAAQRLHLSYIPGGIGVSGSIRGYMNRHRVDVSVETKGSGNSSSTYTRYRIEYRDPIPVDLKITRQGLYQEIGKAFGMQDIEVGNPDFDASLLVKGKDPEKVREFLSAKVQSAIRDLIFTYDNFTITSNCVEVSQRGKERDADAIVRTVRRLAGFCETLMETDAHIAVAPEMPQVEEEPSATPVIEIEPPETSFGLFSKANPIVREPPGSPPEPDHSTSPEAEVPETGPDDIAESFPPVARLPDESTAPKMDEMSVSAPIALEDAAKALFGDSGSALLMSRRFDEQFKDQQVTGSGVLIRVGKFSYDPVFTNTKGVKATVSLIELQGLYSRIPVTVEVAYPSEQHDRLEAQTDDVIPVSGKLVAHDTVMHKFFVVAG